MNESDWRRAVVDVARRAGWKHFYTPYSLGATPGWPDLALIKPPIVLLSELKTPRGKLRPAQEETRALLEDCDRVEYRLWRPDDEADVYATLGLNVRQGRLI